MEGTGRLTCACGFEQEATLYRSVNVTLEPRLKEALLRGELNTITCGRCGMRSTVTSPLLYHDMSRRLMIQILTDGRSEAPAMAQTLREAAAGTSEKFTLRIVFSRDDLVDKVAIADAGLDDRLVEIVKLLTRKQQDPGPGVGPFLFMKVTGEGDDRCLQFFLRGPKGAIRAAIPYVIYENVTRMFSGKLAEEPERATLIVDQDFAMDVVAPIGRGT